MADMTQTPHPYPAALLAGDFPRRFMIITIAAGQQLAAGAVLGEVTAGGEYKLSASAAGDGSETPAVVLWEAVDTTDGAAPGEALLCGDVRGAALTLGDGIDIAAAKKALRPFSLFVS